MSNKIRSFTSIFLCFDSLSPNIVGSSNMGVPVTNTCTTFGTRAGLGVCRKVVLHNNDSIEGPLPINMCVMTNHVRGQKRVTAQWELRSQIFDFIKG